jgi:hypothetical protein
MATDRIEFDHARAMRLLHIATVDPPQQMLHKGQQSQSD